MATLHHVDFLPAGNNDRDLIKLIAILLCFGKLFLVVAHCINGLLHWYEFLCGKFGSRCMALSGRQECQYANPSAIKWLSKPQPWVSNS